MPRLYRTPLLLAGLLAYLAGAAARAQDQGQIAGTIKDQTGGVVVGASIAATNLETKLTLKATSGENGSYLITPVPVGFYDVAVEMKGFRRYVQNRVKVDAATRATVDVPLDLGEVADTITVEASAAVIQAETGQIGRVVESRQVVDLTLAGRNPIVLALLKAGVAGGNFSSFNATSLGGAGLSISGGQQAGNNITFDGVPAVRTRIETSGAMIGQLNPDIIQEAQILTSTYRAEYGRAMDGQVRFVTKSGTQEFHGTISHFFRNSSLDANSWVRNSSANPDDSRRPAPFRFNQPGYTIGGPVYIPKTFNTGKTKLFFLASQEWVRWRREQTNTTTVPSAAMRSGDFSELLSATNPFFRRIVRVNDPLAGVPFANNFIPAARLSRNGAGLLGMYPLPTPSYQQGTANLIQSRPNPQNQRKDTLRLDYYFGQHRLTFSGTAYSYKADDAFRGSFPHSTTRWDRPNFTGRASLTSTLSPRLINEFTFSAANDLVRMYLVDILTPAGMPLWKRDQYGINFPYVLSGPKRIEDRIPTVAINGFTSLDGSSKPGFSNGPILIWDQAMTWMVNSAHSIKFGATFEHAQQNNDDQVARNQNGWFNFVDSGHPQSSGLAIANVALGVFNDYDEIGTAANTLLRSNSFEAFVQDTWKATPVLTIEMGVRYSYHQPWYAKWNDISNFDPRYFDRSPGKIAVLDPRGGYIIAGDPYNGIVLPGSGFPAGAEGKALAASVPGIERLFHGLPRGFATAPKDAFAPRLGVAYRLTKKTVVRAGAGIFYNRQHHHSGNLFRNAPNQPRIEIANGGVDNPGGGLRRDFPQNVGVTETFLAFPAAYSYSFSIQRELWGNTVVDLAYVGKTGIHLSRERNINQMLQAGTRQANPTLNPNALRPWIGLGTIRQFGHTGRSNYNSFQATMDRRFSNGLGFGIAYTFSKSIDTLATPYDAYNPQRALASLDRPHVFQYNFVYELPFFKRASRAVALTLGGWQLSGVTFLSSGSPLSVVDGSDIAGVGSGSAAQPWNLVGDPAISGERGVGLLWFSPAAFARPAAGTFGNAGLNILRGPGSMSWDLAVFKNFRLPERFGAQFRLEAYNFPNHMNLANPITNPASGSFARITSKAGDPRMLQLGLKLSF